MRPDLSYFCCPGCRHCELKNSAANFVTLFEEAQNKYYGDTSLLAQTKPNPLDEEILSTRKKLAEVVNNFETPIGFN